MVSNPGIGYSPNLALRKPRPCGSRSLAAASLAWQVLGSRQAGHPGRASPGKGNQQEATGAFGSNIFVNTGGMGFGVRRQNNKRGRIWGPAIFAGAGAMRRLVAADVVLGKPLHFSIFDDKGRLLLRQGVVVTMPDQVDRLIARGAMCEEIDFQVAVQTPVKPAPVVSPQEKQAAFERVGGLLLNFKHIVTTALKTPEQIDVPARVTKIAQALQETCQDDVNATLAACYLDYQNPYILVHQFMGAVLTEIIARRKGLDGEERLALVCGALTRDWGQIPLQAELERCEGPLPDGLKVKMREHPLQGVHLLGAAGVTERVWLDAIRFHHERLDGSGYPNGLKGEAIPLGARILAIADTYSAMAKPRPYRKKAHYPQNALREIYLKKGMEMDAELANVFISEIGVLPAGSIVRLKCGEIAVIKSPSSKPTGAQAFSIYGKTGMVLAAPVCRDTSLPEYEIAGLVPFSECRSASIMIKQVWRKETI